MNRVILLLGSNMGDRRTYLESACIQIESLLGMIESKSAIYETDAWGNSNLSGFLNQAILIKTELRPIPLLNRILEIEKSMGRQRIEKWEARIIDIDILFYNSEIIMEESLTIPHPLIQMRKFCLLPAVEILPMFIHPVLGKSLTVLLHSCADKLAVRKVVD